MPSRSTVLAVIGATLFGITVAGWFWLVIDLDGPNVRTGSFPAAACAVAWTSGAASLPRAALRSLIAAVMGCAIAAALVLVVDWRTSEVSVSVSFLWWGLAFGVAVLALGYGARHARRRALGRLLCAVLVIPAVGLGIADVVRGAETQGLLTGTASLWLAVVLAQPLHHGPASQRRRRASAVGVVILALVTAGLVTRASLVVEDTNREVVPIDGITPADEAKAVADQFDGRPTPSWRVRP